MTDITPASELVQQWADGFYGGPGFSKVSSDDLYLTARAAQWGADQELEACCALMDDWGLEESDLRTARRPKPPSLKEQALKALEDDDIDVYLIRRALEALDD